MLGLKHWSYAYMHDIYPGDVIIALLSYGVAGYMIVQVASSCGSDGHTLALTDCGEVFSWGDGDYGKLGHGNCYRQKLPKQIDALQGKEVIQVIGYKFLVSHEIHLLHVLRLVFFLCMQVLYTALYQCQIFIAIG